MCYTKLSTNMGYINLFTSALGVMVVFDPVEYNVSENAGSQLYQLRLLGEIDRQVVVTVTSEDGTAEGIPPFLNISYSLAMHPYESFT